MDRWLLNRRVNELGERASIYHDDIRVNEAFVLYAISLNVNDDLVYDHLL